MSEPEAAEKFFAALAKAQSDIKPPTKDETAEVVSKKTGAKFTYTYAGLPAVLDAIRGPFISNGLTLLQMPDYDPATKCALVDWSLYGHGHSIGGTLHIPCGDSAQEIGSAQTYGKRYIALGLSLMCPEDDDDGQRSTARRGEKPEKKSQPTPTPAPTQSEYNKLTVANALFKGTVKAAVTLGLYKEEQADNAEGMLGIINELLGAKYVTPRDVNLAALERATQELKDRIKITEAERKQ